ncbi:MAG TPA: hypothetical protein V6D29_23045 [Leptolyngbyaceae cyanobacterium]
MSHFKFTTIVPNSRYSFALLSLLGTMLFSASPQLSVSASSTLSLTRPQPPVELRAGNSPTRSANRLPSPVRNRVLLHAARETGQSRNSFSILNASAETWPDPCLGIPDPLALCAAVQTSGWRVEVTDGSITRVYRTDATGRTIKEEQQVADTTEFPRLTASRVLEEVMRTSGLPLEQLDITATEPRTWDGCFGLPSLESPMCTMIAISGWRVIVTAPQHVWVYHTNQDGTEIRLNKEASQLGNATITPQLIGNDSQPLGYEAEPNALFTVVESGGIAGRVEKTALFPDGRLVRYRISGDAKSSPETLGQLSPKAVEAFIQQIRSAQIDRFQGLRYSIPPEAADYITVTLMPGANGRTEYADIAVEQLPTGLQQSIQAWHTLLGAQR